MYFESHCHLDFEQFDQDRKQVIERAKRAGVRRVLIAGAKPEHWQKVIALCESDPTMLVAAIGIHPYFLTEANISQIELIAEIAEHPNVVAIGETGLDKKIETNFELQLLALNQHIALANKCDLPVILHHRKTIDELCGILRRANFNGGGVFHAFSGSHQQAQAIVDLGFKLGVGGTITYPRALKTRQVIANMPLGSLVIETDAPDMPIYGKQGERNSPEHLPWIFESLLKLRKERRVDVQQALWQNTVEAFKLTK